MNLPTAAIAQTVRRWAVDFKVAQGVGSRPLGDCDFTKSVSAMIFTLVLCSV